MERELVIGIDIGGTNTKFGVVNSAGKILAKGEMKTTGYAQPKNFVDDLEVHLKPMIDKYGGKNNFLGIGIGAPNGNYYSGCIEHAANLEWEGLVPIVEMISSNFEIPALLTNDANAAAMGEMQYGAAKGMKDFIVITLGTGVGSGIVANGKLVMGHDGFAGELGHTILRPGGRLHPGTGLKGSLEMYCSAGGVVANALELLAVDPTPSLLRDIDPEKLTSKKVLNARTRGIKRRSKHLNTPVNYSAKRLLIL
jgi:glucokinase